MILDSATLYYRAFYALPEKLTAPDGHPNNAVRGFLTMLTKLRQLHSPSGLVAAWDTDWRPQWRVDLIPSYKAHRVEDIQILGEESEADQEIIPDTLAPQIGAIGELLDAIGIARIGVPGYEADDVIASVASQSQVSNLVVSSDKDLVQVISETTSMLMQTTGGIENWPILGPGQIVDKFGVPVAGYRDFAVLRGDPSDGLPGIGGIGAKTAAALISSFGSIEKMVKQISAGQIEKPLTPRLAERIIEGQDYIHRAQKVVTAETELPIPESGKAIPSEPQDPDKLASLAAEWGVERFVDQLLTVSSIAE